MERIQMKTDGSLDWARIRPGALSSDRSSRVWWAYGDRTHDLRIKSLVLSAGQGVSQLFRETNDSDRVL